jgi:hypothetical protein
MESYARRFGARTVPGYSRRWNGTVTNPVLRRSFGDEGSSYQDLK